MSRIASAAFVVAIASMALRVVVGTDDPSLALSVLRNLGMPFLVVGITLRYAARDDLSGDRDLVAAATALVATLAMMAAGIAADRHLGAAPAFLAIAVGLFGLAVVALRRAAARRRNA